MTWKCSVVNVLGGGKGGVIAIRNMSIGEQGACAPLQPPSSTSSAPIVTCPRRT